MTTQRYMGPQLECDFCGVDVPTPDAAVFPCRDFERSVIYRGDTLMVETCGCHTRIPREDGDRIITQSVLGGWCACPTCAYLVREGNKDSLARKAALEAERRHGPFVRPDADLSMAAQDTLGGRTVNVAADWASFFRLNHLAFWYHREPEGN